MEVKLKRHIATWVLLAVYVPMLVFSSLHVHSAASAAEAECADCVLHHCGGHLQQHSSSSHPCVLCQFLTLQFLAVAIATVVCYSKQSKISFAQRRSFVHFESCGITTLRALPSV